jgi:hypothetical protein
LLTRDGGVGNGGTLCVDDAGAEGHQIAGVIVIVAKTRLNAGWAATRCCS